MTLGTIYISGTCVSFAYTGGIGLKYIALGDVTIAVTFGPMVFVFAYVSQTGLLVIAPIIYSLPLALLTEGCLHTNNVRDMKNDKEAGITTVALLLGETGSYIMFLILLFAPYAAFVLMLICSSLSFCLPLITFPAAFQIERLYRDKHYNEAIINVAHLNTKVTLFYICAVLLG
jgi:1,4-dihydroxy-2-naphthoate octaprenyltransferase